MTTVLLHLLISFSLFSIIAPPASPPLPPPSPPPTNCSDELLTFSACLPFISSYPNNHTRLPSSQCCHEIASAVTSGTAVCFCYLIRQPFMLGFPLNSTRFLSLATLCRVKDGGNKTRISLDSLCSGSPILPPLLSITGPDGHHPAEQQSPGRKGSDGPSKHNSGPDNPAPPSTTRPSTCSEATKNAEAPAPVPESMAKPADDYLNFEPQHASAANVGKQPSLSAKFARYSSKWRWFMPQIMILAPHLSTYL